MASSVAPMAAQPQVKIKLAFMNMGGYPRFAQGAAGHKHYVRRLPIELTALLGCGSKARDIVGLVGINEYWFEWMTEHFLPSFAAGKYSAHHDEHDVAIIWDSTIVTPVNASNPAVDIVNFFVRDYHPDRDWARRSFLVIWFIYLASPQVHFHAAVTHSARGSSPGSKVGERQSFVNFMSKVALHAMKTLLVNCHLPQLDEGKRDHMSFIMGDWNVTTGAMCKEVSDSIILAGANTATGMMMTAKWRGAPKEGRDHVAIFCEANAWAGEKDKINPSVYNALHTISKEHMPLFFTISKGPEAPWTSLAAVVAPAPTPRLLAASAPPPAPVLDPVPVPLTPPQLCQASPRAVAAATVSSSAPAANGVIRILSRSRTKSQTKSEG